jgi:nucleoside-diphosphate-sugar epimerase
MRLLFTGHRGFLGRELVPILRNDFEVLTFEGDYSVYEPVEKFVRENAVDKILHAAVRGGRRNKLDTQEILQNNIETTVNILRLHLPTLLFCSGAIYNRARSIYRAKEVDSLSSFPRDYYGQSKFLANSLAKNQPHCNVLRFFNVFGPTEGFDRFISFNISRYLDREPMIIFSDFEMDFFFVKDSVPVISSWLNGEQLPPEINMVYETKYLFSEICKFINSLEDYSVPIDIQDSGKKKHYSGNGELLSSLGFDFQGLEEGILQMYKWIKTSS